MDFVYSISNGNYFVSSQDNFHLIVVNVRDVNIVVGIPQKDLKFELSSFNINTKGNEQYGNVIVNFQNKNYYLTYDSKNQDSNLILSLTLNDVKNQTFVFSTDGRIILPLYQPEIGIKNINSKLVGDTNLIKLLWKFSSFKPYPDGYISIWNTNLYGRQLSDLDQYFNNSSESSCHCGVGASCDYSYQTQLASESCQSGFATEPYCLKTKWPEQNKNKCCVGDLSILAKEKKGDITITTNKFDFGQCKLLHNTNICGRNFTDNDINKAGENQNVRVGSWFPFSKDCSSNIDTVNFCSQQDTLRNRPIILTNLNCMNWCRDNTNECKISKQQYCEQYPFDTACIDWCSKNEIKADSCKQIVDNFCQGKNLEQDVCIRLCNNLEGNCDKKLLDYCSSLGTGASQSQICGCFMGRQYFENYFKSLKSKGASSAIIPEIPECLYAGCVSAPIQTHKFYTEIKGGVRPCPDIQQCISEVHIDNQGTIIGDITIKQENKCNFALRPSDCKINEIIDEKSNRCTGCPDISFPDSVKKNCICPSNMQTLKNNKCVCPDTFIFTEDGKSCTCPPTFILSLDKKSCICPEGKVIDKDGFCNTPSPEDFTPQLIDYIKKDMPINNEIDKEKIIINSPEMASKIINNGCNSNLQFAKECANFIPYICSINGAKNYCKDNKDDFEFCNIDGTPKNITNVYNFECNKILKSNQCKDDEYYDKIDNKCKKCPSDMELKPDKSGCVKKCDDNE